MGPEETRGGQGPGDWKVAPGNGDVAEGVSEGEGVDAGAAGAAGADNPSGWHPRVVNPDGAVMDYGFVMAGTGE